MGLITNFVNILLICTVVIASAADQASCPTKCKCIGNKIYCNDKGLTAIPTNMPTNAKEVWLQNNKISHIDASSLANMSNVVNLHLHGNNLTRLPDYLFTSLTKLHTLTLQDNRISAVSSTAFGSPSNLVYLNLGHNQMRELNKESFAPLKRLQYLILDYNPLRCCDVKSAISSLRRGVVRSLRGSCSAPDGRQLQLNRLSEQSFSCRPPCLPMQKVTQLESRLVLTKETFEEKCDTVRFEAPVDKRLRLKVSSRNTLARFSCPDNGLLVEVSGAREGCIGHNADYNSWSLPSNATVRFPQIYLLATDAGWRPEDRIVIDVALE